jgi:protein tyrosine phosphatase (PTP) superfamily phosphohydrolase (DUF442 family)
MPKARRTMAMRNWSRRALICTALLTAALLTLAQAPPQAGQKAQKRGALAYPRSDVPGLENFAKVSDTLYRGAQPKREGFIQLRAMGVKTIVDLRDHHSDLKNLRGLGFRYAHIPCESIRPEEGNVLAFLKVVTDPNNQPVFVHCKHGSDRTGMMVACYRMVVQGWYREHSMAELPNFGFHNIWLDIKIFLQNMDPQAMVQKLDQSSEPPIATIP